MSYFYRITYSPPFRCSQAGPTCQRSVLCTPHSLTRVAPLVSLTLPPLSRGTAPSPGAHSCQGSRPTSPPHATTRPQLLVPFPSPVVHLVQNHHRSELVDDARPPSRPRPGAPQRVCPAILTRGPPLPTKAPPQSSSTRGKTVGRTPSLSPVLSSLSSVTPCPLLDRWYLLLAAL
jgi:hypothetical protein